MNIKIILFIIVLILTSVATTLIYQNTQQADINYFKGHKYFEKGYYSKAIKFYEKVLLIDPARLDALTDLARCYQWTKRYEQAIDAFQKSLLITPEDNEIKESLAETYSWVKEYKKAINLYSEILETTDNIDIKRELAEVYIWSNHFEEAKEILLEILKIIPEDKKARLLLARAMQYSGQSKQAIEIYKKLLKEANDNE